MSHERQIGCATRGGDASRATEDYAIALALEKRAELIFLYVVDAGFAAGQTGKFDLDMVADDLREIGKIVLEQAQERAHEQGVRARGEMREGDVAEEIQQFIERHKEMDVLVVGHLGEDLREHLRSVLKNVEGKRCAVTEVEQH
jgi:nucleotide-binding universal stress UspA family protein